MTTIVQKMPSRPTINVQSLSQPFEPISFKKSVMTKTADMFSTKDEMKDWVWKGSESKEISGLAQYKNEFEINEGIKLSREGLVNFIEDAIKKE